MIDGVVHENNTLSPIEGAIERQLFLYQLQEDSAIQACSRFRSMTHSSNILPLV